MKQLTADAQSDMERRLQKMEREYCFYRLAGVAIVISVAALVAMGQTKRPVISKTIESERFVLRDSAGRLRGGLAVDRDGVARLALADEKGLTHATLSVDRNGGAGLFLTDQKGTIRAGVALLSDGTPDLGLADAKGEVRVGLGFDKNTQSPTLVFYGRDKVPVTRIP